MSLTSPMNWILGFFLQIWFIFDIMVYEDKKFVKLMNKMFLKKFFINWM